MTQDQEFWKIDADYFEHKVTQKYELQTVPGLTEETIRQISADKKEPQWMLDFRLKCFELYKKLPMPNSWPDGPDLKELDLTSISYYIKPGTKTESDWNKVPAEIKKTFERLGIPEAERRSLAGAGAQFESEVVYHNLKKQWEDLGVIFTDCDVALREHEELFKKYFMKCVPPTLHKFAALHGAVWSGGTFIFVPKGIKVGLPLQAYFRMNIAGAGQFEHTLIIVDDDAEVNYIEGCFTKGTKIATNPSYKAIEQIQVGDKVLTHTGEYKKVYHIHERHRYNGDLYKIKIWGDPSSTIECTSEHPFLVVKRKRANERNKVWGAGWMHAKHLNKRDYLLIPINRKIVSQEFREFPIIFKRKEQGRKIRMSKDFFRLIGYYLAEGSVSTDSYLNFSFGEHERFYINNVKHILQKMGITRIREVPHKRNHGISVVVSDAAFARVFKQFGTSAKSKHLPLWAILEHPEKQREIMIGSFRGDGNYFNERYEKGLKEAIRLNTISEKLARQIRDMLLRLNIVSFINKRTRRKEGRQTMYSVGITGEYMISMGGLLGIKIIEKMNGKKRATKFYLDEKYAYMPIRKITKQRVKNTKVYNFAVEKDETYTVNGITVHNCSAPTYTSSSLHAGCVEIFVNKGARARYSSMENWAKNVFNLNTKRAIVDDNGIIEWVNGNMGCLTEDSLIYTNPKGPTKIVSLKPGDHVFALNEKEKKLKRAKVKAVVYSGDKKVYNLRVAGREVRASANHPFLTLQRKKINANHRKSKFYFEWKPLEIIKKGDLIAIAKRLPDMGQPYLLPKINYGNLVNSNNQYSKFSMSTQHLFKQINLPEYTTEDLMWFFGVYVGDGNLWKPKKGGAKINIAIHEKSDLRKPLIEAIKKEFNYEVKYQKDRYVIINSNILANLLEELGFGGLASSKRIPHWVHTLPVKQRLAFLGGYFDADGHIGKGGVYLTSINKKLLEDSKQLAIGCGIGVSRIFNHMPAGKRVILDKECNALGSYRLLLNGKEVINIKTKSNLYKNKLNSLKPRRNYSTGNRMNFRHQTSDELGFAKIDEIRYEGVKPTYDIEVENYHNFIANGIIVHNSKTTMLYPCSILKGKGARSDFLGIAVASKGQFQDTGAKVIHAAPNTTSTIRSKSISKDGGITTYRGLVQIAKQAANSKVHVQCDALMLDDLSKSNTVPYMDVDNKTSEVGHEATVSKIGDEQLFYLMSRGLSEEQARQMIVSGFIEPIIKALPIEYAVELNRLIELEMENALG